MPYEQPIGDVPLMQSGKKGSRKSLGFLNILYKRYIATLEHASVFQAIAPEI